jgi:hypothetical protein
MHGVLATCIGHNSAPWHTNRNAPKSNTWGCGGNPSDAVPAALLHALCTTAAATAAMGTCRDRQPAFAAVHGQLQIVLLHCLSFANAAHSTQLWQMCLPAEEGPSSGPAAPAERKDRTAPQRRYACWACHQLWFSQAHQCYGRSANQQASLPMSLPPSASSLHPGAPPPTLRAVLRNSPSN